MAVVVAVQRVASTFEQEINIILDGRDIKNTKHVIKTAYNIANECLETIDQSFEERRKKRPWA